MNIAAEMRALARSIHARLWRPANAVADSDIDLGGKDTARALAEITQRNIIEHLQFERECKLAAANSAKKVAK